MKKIIIIPAYNEGANLLKVVGDIQSNASDYDYIIINDGSTDETREICAKNNFNVINLPVNLGIGGAMQTGYKYAYENNYDIAVQLDGDGQHDSRELNKLCEFMINNNQNMVIGSRFIDKEGFQSTLARRVGIIYFTKLIKILTKKNITDPTSGFRMVDKEIIQLFSKDYPRDYPEPESIVSVIMTNNKIAEVPVLMKERQGGISSIRAHKTVYYMIKVTLAILITFSRSKGNKVI